MPGTRKMEKFELDAVAKAREDELVEVNGGAQRATSMAAPIADRTSGVVGHDGAELPARPFDSRPDAAARPFDPRAEVDDRAPRDHLSRAAPTSSDHVRRADLPERPFAPRGTHDEAVSGERPTLPVDVRVQRENELAMSAELPARPFEPREVDVSGAAATQHAVHQAPTPVVGWVPNEWVPPQEALSPSPDGNSGPRDVEALRTRLTRKFVSLAESVTEAFRDVAIGRAAYAVELMAPEGMSTGGGKQALQHLRLRPRHPGFAVLVAGTVNPVEQRAELRDYEHVAALHHARFKGPLDFGRDEWEHFLRRAEVVLQSSGIQSMRAPPPRELLDEQRRSMQRVSKGALALLVAVLLAAAIVVWRVFVTLTHG
ncbi:MAG TPA: hypothetical protein VM925_27430 [Labilithrix sp.]|nr:hypothetical protein [Labilithrix sp.]